MTTTNHQEPKPVRGVKPWVRTQRIMLAVAILVFVAPCILIISVKHFSDKNLAGYVDAIRSEGLPVSVIDLPNWQAALSQGAGEAQTSGEPGGATAAERCLQAVALLQPEGGSPSVDAINGILERYDEEGTLAPEAGEQLRAQVAANAQAVELLRQASSLPPGNFPVDFTAGWDMDLPYQGGIRRAARLLRAEAVAATLENDPERAFQALVAAIALSRPLQNDILLSSQLLRVGCNSNALRALGQVLGMARLDEAHLVRLQELFSAAYPEDAFSNALVSERTFALLLFQNPALMFGEDERAVVVDAEEYDLPMFQKASAPAVFLAERSEYFDGMRELINALRLPYPESQAVFERVAGQPRLRFHSHSNPGANTSPGANRPHHPPRPGLRGMFLSYSRLPQVMARDRARLNQGAAALAVERYRLARGTAPERLEALVPEYLAAPPVDPFDLQPLRYQQDDKGYLIYSVSVNGKDEAGKAGEFADQGDLPFRVNYPQ